MAANCCLPSLPHLQAAFLSIVPRIELHGRVCFRTKNFQDQQEAVAEMVGLCWKWFVRLAEQGKDATHFPSVLATFAARAVYNGRRVAGTCKAKDALSPVAQRRHGFAVGRLPDVSTLNGNPLFDALHAPARRRPLCTARAAKVASTEGKRVASLPCSASRTNQRQLRATISPMASALRSGHRTWRK